MCSVETELKGSRIEKHMERVLRTLKPRTQTLGQSTNKYGICKRIDIQAQIDNHDILIHIGSKLTRPGSFLVLPCVFLLIGSKSIKLLASIGYFA